MKRAALGVLMLAAVAGVASPARGASGRHAGEAAAEPPASRAGSDTPPAGPSHTLADVPVDAVCPHRFVVTVDGHDLELVLCRSHPLDQFNPDITRVIVTVHGSGRDADNYLARVQAAAVDVGQAQNTLILAPQLLEEEDLDPHGLGSEVLFWGGGWRQGHLSATTDDHPRPARISSFAVVERLLEQVITGGYFPNVEAVVITGHSAGGQYTNRFAAGSQIEDRLLAPAGIRVRYVIANPGCYVYFDGQRRLEGTVDQFAWLTPEQEQACPGYNEYKFGLEGLNSYMAAVGVSTIRWQYHRREVIHLIGELDTEPLLLHCEEVWQGIHRFERATIYFNYLQHFFGPSVLTAHRKAIVPGAGHSSAQMFASSYGKRYLFDHDGGDEVTLFVDAAADPGGDGLSWATALQDLQVAIVAAASSGGDVVQIWVADGVYRPDCGTGDRRFSFPVLNGVGIYGGFAGADSAVYPGGETALEQRDPATNLTELSGDLNGDDQSGGDQSDNSFLVVDTRFADQTAVLDGFVITGEAGSPGVLRVDAAAPPGGDGLSWSAAIDDLAQAITTAAYSWGHFKEIWVARGRYTPDGGTGDRDRSFLLHDGLALCGGFLPGMSREDQRDPQANPTVLTGDLAGDDGTGGSTAENSFHVLQGNGADQTATLDGFIITAGNANGEGTRRDAGGGLYNVGASPLIRDCLFIANSADWGGAVENSHNSNPSVQDCVFAGNHSREDGGAISNWESSPVFTRCRFAGNRAGDDGGALRCNRSELTCTACLLTGNACGDNGGAFYDGSGDESDSRHRFISSTLAHNAAPDRGGAVGIIGTCLPQVENCVLWGNTAPKGSQVGLSSGASLTAGYSDLQGGQEAVYLGSGSAVEWGPGNIDADPQFAGGPAGTWTAGAVYDPESVQITFTDADAAWAVEEYAGAALNPDTSQALHLLIVSNTATTMTAWADWATVDAAASSVTAGTSYQVHSHDLNRLGGSPCVDAGNNQAVPADVETDVAGRPRFVDDPETADTGVPDPPDRPEVTDMGAFEYFADCNADGQPDGWEEWQLQAVSACSRLSHGEAGPFCLELIAGAGANAIEPRAAGVRELLCRMNVSADAATVSGDHVQVDCVHGDYAGTITTSLQDAADCPNSTIVLGFEPALPDQDCCWITFGGMTSAYGHPAATGFAVRTLAGDVDRSGTVSSVDASSIKPRFGAKTGDTSFLYDLDASGTISSVDASFIKPRFGHTAPTCP